MKSLQTGQNFIFKKFANGAGGEGIILTVHADADALLAVAGAEGAAQFHLILQAFFIDQFTQLFHDHAGTFQMAGTSDAYDDFHNDIFLRFVFLHFCLLSADRKKADGQAEKSLYII